MEVKGACYDAIVRIGFQGRIEAGNPGHFGALLQKISIAVYKNRSVSDSPKSEVRAGTNSTCQARVPTAVIYTQEAMSYTKHVVSMKQMVS
jgi:hypothetical protein